VGEEGMEIARLNYDFPFSIYHFHLSLPVVPGRDQTLQG
jgi:hypothetical protein